MKKPIKNISDLTKSLVANYEGLQSGSVSEKEARNFNNVAGKIISSAKLNLDYNKPMKNRRKVMFLETV